MSNFYLCMRFLDTVDEVHLGSGASAHLTAQPALIGEYPTYEEGIVALRVLYAVFDAAASRLSGPSRVDAALPEENMFYGDPQKHTWRMRFTTYSPGFRTSVEYTLMTAAEYSAMWQKVDESLQAEVAALLEKARGARKV